MSNLTLGSLFDGSGGFPLGGLISGITPLWASEIEPFPIRVTTKRLPNMKHYGDVSLMDGGKIEPVDIITFGSPCQDMSIAGKREGLDGNRSGLFYEAIRIVKEMRCATDGKYPRYIVWENVPGAFSSNKGEDFRLVLESIARVTDETVSVPKASKWTNAGEIVGDGYSIAWRVLDAQYWGVPQRRKRIYLVADFTGGSAGEVLFKSESLSGYLEQSRGTWKGTACDAEESAEETGTICLNDQGGQRMDVTKGKTNTLRAQSNHPPLVFENHAQDARYTGPHDISQTILSTFGTGGNNQPFVVEEPKAYDVRFTSLGTRNMRANVYETDTSRTIDTGGNSPANNQGGVAVVALEGNGARPSHKGPGFSEDDVSYTLNATEHHAVAFAEKAATLSANDGPKGPSSQQLKNPEENFVATLTYGIDRASYNMGRNAKFGMVVEKEVEPTMVSRGPGAVAHPVYHSSKNSFHTKFTDEDITDTLVATDYKDPPTVSEEPDYIVRRLTPTECARLQGFPDWWCDDLGTQKPTDEEMYFWYKVFETWRKATNPTGKPKTSKQIRKWLQDPHTDSAEYKMWGNGVCLNIVVMLMFGIKWAAEQEE